MKYMWVSSGFVLGLTTLSIALGSVPSRTQVTDDTALYQNLSEIRAARQGDLNFDSDIERLSAREDRYREKLPSLAEHSRLKGPIKRISESKYRYSSASSRSAKRTVRQ